MSAWRDRWSLDRLMPYRAWTGSVTGETLRADAHAGLAGGIVVMPQAVAFATLAGLPPEFGLYAAMVPTVIAALYGSSAQMVSGPAATISVVLYSALHPVGVPGTEQYVQAAITLTFLVGLTQLLMGVARLGVLAEFISNAVIVGFTTGTAVIILTSQLRDFLGIGIVRGLNFYEILIACYRRIPDWHWPTIAVGVITIACGVLARRHLRRVPPMLAAIGGGTALYLVIRLAWPDAASNITTVGALPSTLPPPTRPDLSHGTVRELAPTALALALLSLTQSVSIARTIATQTGQIVNGSQEFIGQGLANVSASFFSGFAGAGSFTRSALNFHAGARTPLAAVFSALVLAAAVIAIAPLAAWLPKATLAAVLLIVAMGLVDLGKIKRILLASRGDAAVMLVTFAATLMLDLDFAIMVGVLLSLVMYLSRTARPEVALRVPDPRLRNRRLATDATLPECPQLRIVRIDGALFFGAVDYVAQRLRLLQNRSPDQKHLCILARSINFADVAGADLLANVAAERRRAGGALYLTHAKPGVLDVLERGRYLEAIGRENLFDSKGEAISGIFERLDREICKRCDRRIFLECASVPRVTEAEAEAEADGEAAAARPRP